MDSYTRSDLVSFGNYLLSEQRTEGFYNHPVLPPFTAPERLAQVHHADVENFNGQIHSQNNDRL